MFSEKLKQYREDCGLTQEDFAEATGISRGVISMLEIDKRPPSQKVLSLLSKYSGKNIDWWRGNSEKEYGDLNALNALMDYMVDKDMVNKDGTTDAKNKEFIWRMIEAEFKNKIEKKVSK